MPIFAFLLQLVAAAVISGGSTPADGNDTPTSELAARLEADGYVNIARMDSTILVRLMYATPDNFVGVNMYGDFNQAYLHPDAAKALLKAQKALKEIEPTYTLLIKDATRPMTVQKRMYDAVRGTAKARYVSNPANGGGMHNYGVAVDVTIADAEGNEISMGTPVDHLGPEAHINGEGWLVKQGKITAQDKANRELLRKVMIAGGFRPLYSEWWHFNLVPRSVARTKYKLVP